MFNLFQDKFKLITREKHNVDDGIEYLVAETEQEIECFWQYVANDQLTVVGGNIVKGQLKKGDATALVKSGTLINWDEIVNLDHYVVKNGHKFRIITATRRPRNFIHLELKRLEG